MRLGKAQPVTVESILGLIIFWGALVVGSALLLTPFFLFISKVYPKAALGVPAKIVTVLVGAGALWYAIPKAVHLLFG